MFPSSTPSFTTPTSGETLAAGGHTSLHVAEEANIVALANKVGTGASTPTSTSVLVGNGTGTSAWGQVNLTNQVSGLLPTTNGGTGTTSTTGSGSNVFNNSPTIITPTITNPSVTTGTFTNPTTTGLANTGGLTTDTATISGNETVSGNLSVTGTTTIQGNKPWQYLGYAQSTSAFTTGNTSPTQVTGVTVTVTVPTGATKVKVTAFAVYSLCNTNSKNIYGTLWTGQVGSPGVQIQETQVTQATANYANPFGMIAVIPAVAGSTTFCLGANADNGSVMMTLGAASTSPIFILVECC